MNVERYRATSASVWQKAASWSVSSLYGVLLAALLIVAVVIGKV